MTSEIGTVYLKTANPDRLTTFYQDVIGLQVNRNDNDTTYLGAGGKDLLALIHTPDGKHYQGTTGLYHFALLVPTRRDLAMSIKRLAHTRTRIQGMSDHLVSEAVYLADPDGNGIEIYRDRPKDDWYENGQFRMDSLPIDLDGIMSEIDMQTEDWQGMAPGTTMGHIHLHIADIPQASAFYHGALGLDLMADWSSALFLSYDGYHHHIGANTWAGRVPPPADAIGLDRFELRTDAARIDTILGQLDGNIEARDDGYLIRDPSQNNVVLQAV